MKDILSAANYLRTHHQAPSVMIGHSFGGTAMLKASHDVPECKAVATIGSPCSPGHIIHQFANQLEEIEEEGEAKVMLSGRPFVIKDQFIEDVTTQDVIKCLPDLHRALMVFHSPHDAVVGINNAAHIYSNSRHPKSFVSLDQADHLLLKNPADAEYVAHTLAAWAVRYI